MPSAAILPASLAIPRSSNRSLSSCKAFNGPDVFRLFTTVSSSFTAAGDLASLATIRMGGGPRTYPGGVSKWQWKRMQAKKSKQLLKARLCRERQLYEMRKRAELKAAISELERPWEVVERAPVLFSSSADEQIKVLADRFQRPNGFDMWSERDGPRLFRSPDDLPSARFFPKGAVHSVKPYGVISEELADGRGKGEKVMTYDDWIARGAGGMGRGRRARVLPDSNQLEREQSVPVEEESGDAGCNRGSYCSDPELVVAGSKQAEYELDGHFGRHGGNRGSHGSDSDLAADGSSINGDDIVGDFGRRGGWDRNWGARRSDSELADAGSKMQRHEMDVSFGRRGVGGGHGRYRDFNGSHSELAVNGSSMERDELASDFGGRGGDDQNQGSEMPGSFDRRRGRGGNRGYYRSYSELEKEDNEGSFGKRDGRGGNRNAMAGGFDRRGGRGRNRVSYRSYSELEKEENEGSFGKRDGRGGNPNAMAGGFDRRGGRSKNRVSYRSYSEVEKEENESSFGKRDDRGGNRNVMAGGFDRRGGRGRNRGSYRSYSELEKEENEGGFGKRDGRGGNWNAMAGGFDRRGGRGRNRGSYRSYSELKIEESEGGFDKRDGRGGNLNAIAGSFDRRGGRGGNRDSYLSDSELAVSGSRMERDDIDGGFGKRGGHGRNRNSYGSDSGPDIADSRKGRFEITGRRIRDYSYGGGVSLRPTTELRFVEGDNSEERAEVWSKERNDGFRVSRGWKPIVI